MDTIRLIMQGDVPPRVRRFTKLVGKGINEFDMIRDGDHILLGVSGGKDSLALALALALRRKWLPIKYRLTALQIEWREFPVAPEVGDRLDEYFDILQIPYSRRPAQMMPPSFKGRFDCYLCSRNRKRILFNELGRLGTDKVALAHHLDDIIETTLMNLFFHGTFSTMMPVQKFFEGKIQMIRPMCRVPEATVANLSRAIGLPVMTTDCPRRDTNKRREIKKVISSMTHLNRHARGNIYRAPWNIVSEYLPLALKRDGISNTLDR